MQLHRGLFVTLLPLLLTCCRNQVASRIATTVQHLSDGDSIVWEWPDSLPPAHCDTIVLADTTLTGVENAWTNSLAISSWAKARGAPTFDAYPAATIYRGPPAPVNLASAREAYRFRTLLRERSREGPNFDGHYTLVAWGCGSPCVRVAIVDARTGHVFIFPDSFTRPPMFRRDSRLLVFDPTGFLTLDSARPNNPDVEFHEWTGSAARLILHLDASRAAVRPSRFGVHDKYPPFPRLKGGPDDLACLPKRRSA